MKPLPAPNVPGKTELERFDNAMRQVLSVSKEELLKREGREKKPQQRKRRPKKSCTHRSPLSAVVYQPHQLSRWTIFFFGFESMGRFMAFHDFPGCVNQSAVSRLVNSRDAANRSVSTFDPQINKLFVHTILPSC